MKFITHICRVCLLALSIVLCCGLTFYGQKNRTSTAVKKERIQANRQIKQTQKRLQDNQLLTRQRLNDLNSLNSQIEQLEGELARLDRQIAANERQIKSTEDSIAEISRTIGLLRQSARRHLVESRTRRQSMSAASMILSSQNFRQAVKRTSYLKQLDKSRTKQTLALKNNMAVLSLKRNKLDSLRIIQEKNRHNSLVRHSTLLEHKSQGEQLMAILKKQNAALEKELSERQQRVSLLDQELERIIAEEQRIAEEQERERQLQAERERQAQAERERLLQAERERQAQQEREMQAEQERQLQAERERRIKEGRQLADEQYRQEKERLEQERKRLSELAAKKSKQSPQPKTKGKDKSKERTPATQPKIEAPQLTFAQSKGQLSFPVTGKYSIVGKFGRNQYGNLSRVQVENFGIDIEAQKNASALAVFPGTVSSIFKIDGYNNIVMVRHGEYLTVYANIDKLSVKKGDSVNVGQPLGSIYADPDDNHRSILHFEVRREREKLNPLEWLKQ